MKAVVGAFSVIVQLHRLIVYSTRMLYLISHSPITISTNTLHTSQSAGGATTLVDCTFTTQLTWRDECNLSQWLNSPDLRSLFNNHTPQSKANLNLYTFFLFGSFGRLDNVPQNIRTELQQFCQIDTERFDIFVAH